MRAHVKWIVSLVITYGPLIFLRYFCGYAWVDILTLSAPEGTNEERFHHY